MITLKEGAFKGNFSPKNVTKWIKQVLAEKPDASILVIQSMKYIEEYMQSLADEGILEFEDTGAGTTPYMEHIGPTSNPFHITFIDTGYTSVDTIHSDTDFLVKTYDCIFVQNTLIARRDYIDTVTSGLVILRKRGVTKKRKVPKQVAVPTDTMLEWVYEQIGWTDATHPDPGVSNLMLIVPKEDVNNVTAAYTDNDGWTVDIYESSTWITNHKSGSVIHLVGVDTFAKLSKEVYERIQECVAHPRVSDDILDRARMLCNIDQPYNDGAIKTTGEPRQFSTGMQRDSDTNKVKWSLMPPHMWVAMDISNCKDIAAIMSNWLMLHDDSILRTLFGKLLVEDPTYLIGLSERYEGGAKTYGTCNWAYAAPISVFLDSLGRHLYAADKTDEDHVSAAIWNLSALIHILQLVESGILPKSYIDIPAYQTMALEGLQTQDTD